MPLLLTAYADGRLSLVDIARLGATNAAKRWNLNRGVIEVGKEADLIILDFSKQWLIKNKNLYSQCGWSPWDGLRVDGKLEEVYIDGKKKPL